MCCANCYVGVHDTVQVSCEISVSFQVSSSIFIVILDAICAHKILDICFVSHYFSKQKFAQAYIDLVNIISYVARNPYKFQ